jgi:hypothetical protein
MKTKKQFLKTNQAASVLGAMLLAALAQGTTTAEGQSIVVKVAPPVVTVAPDNYVYYPHYGVYYNRDRHQFVYLKGDTWITAAAPDGIGADMVLASPSVVMDFHDSPERHHADILKRYPRNWAPAGDHPDRDHDRQ